MRGEGVKKVSRTPKWSKIEYIVDWSTARDFKVWGRSQTTFTRRGG